MELAPQISVVVPAYNAAGYLERALDSVLAQTGCHYELIIVDNNSADATVAIARKYQEQYPDLIFVLTESKPGASAARNHGLATARAPWVQFLDADDVLLPGKLERQAGLTAPDIDWIIGSIVLRNEGGAERVATIATDSWRGLLTYTGLGHLNANLFRTETLRSFGGFNEDYPNCNDFDLFFRLLKSDCAYREDLVPGAVHIHHGGPRITNTNREDMARRRLELTERVIDYLEGEKPAYFRENRAMINTALLRVIRKQASVDIDAAAENFRQRFPKGYRKHDFEVSQLPKYLLAYPIFGFGLVERCRLLASAVLPSAFKRRIK